MTCGRLTRADTIGLLERAIGYALGSLHLVTPDALARPTPCRGWTLGMLLTHLDESVTALSEAVETGRVDLGPAPVDVSVDPVVAIRRNATRLLGAWAGARRVGNARIGGQPLGMEIVSITGSLELAVHGWDVAAACGQDRPIPEALAAELLPLASLLATPDDRPARFAEPVPARNSDRPGDRLVAFLGRDPGECR